MDNHSQNGGDARAWRRFSQALLGSFAALLTLIYVANVLIDPYDTLPFTLPFERAVVSGDQRYMYPQIAHSKKFNSIIIGTSTSRMLDPEILNKDFDAAFANLSVNSATPWEQLEVLSYFIRHSGAPKVLLIGLDGGWCGENADRIRTYHDFPGWLYDDNPWNDLPHLLNTSALMISQRMVRYWLGIYRENARFDGYLLHLRPDSEYEPAVARELIWPNGRTRKTFDPPVVLTDKEKAEVSTPAVTWLDTHLKALPASTIKLLVFMPVHVSAQTNPGGRDDAIEAECRSRIVAVAKKYRAIALDWGIPSPITRDDTNYWDLVHYRRPIGDRIARDVGQYFRENKVPDDGVFRVLAR